MARADTSPLAFLSALPLFKALDKAALARLAAATTRHTFKKGERVFSKGDAMTGLYVLVYGEIRLLARTPARGERLTGVVRAGRSFGEAMMFLERPAVVDAQAATDALVLHLPKEAVFQEIERSPLFARRIIAALSQRVQSLVEELDRQAQGGGRARLVDYLARGCKGAAGPTVFTLPAPKAAIALHLNLTPEHLSRLLRELARDGLIEVNGRAITVPDVGRLGASGNAAAA